MNNEYDQIPHTQIPHTDAAVSRATWIIGVTAALVLGIAIGAAAGDATASPAPCASATSTRSE